MKKLALYSTILALALSASAQETHFPGPNVISPSALGGTSASVSASANPVGVTALPAPNAQPVSATAKTGSNAAVGSNATQGGTSASKQIGICPPIIVDGPLVGPLCK